MKYIYFELNFYIFLKILFSNKKNYFFLKNNQENLKKKFLNKKKNCKFINFQTSKINYKNQNIHFIADKLTDDYTREIVNDLFKSKIIQECNKKFLNNDLRLAVSRYIYLELNSLVLKLKTVDQFLNGKKVIDYYLSDKRLKEYIENKNSGVMLKMQKLSFKKIKLKLIIIIYISLNKLLANLNINNYKPVNKILINSENNLNFKKYLRGDNFFLKKKFKKIIISENSKNLDSHILKNNNVEIIDNFNLIFSKQDKNINNNIDNIFNSLLLNEKFKEEFSGLVNYLNNIRFIMKKISPIFIKNKIKYSISSSSDIVTLSIEMLRHFFKFKTISYQYSFIKNSNPIMSNCSNVMFIFSNYFFSLFNNFYSKPMETKVSGYLYSSLIKFCKSKEKFLKKKLSIKKNTFIVSYFDENCSNSNWYLSTIKDMEKKYVNFAKFVLTNEDITLLIKTQFLHNNPSVLFPKNEFIISALKTRRFIEIDQSHFLDNNKDSNTRNIVLPMMVAQISDITISEKYGGTTSLECILLKKKNILINDKNFKSNFDNLLDSNIQFKDLDNLLQRLLIFKKNFNKNINDELGSWKKIIIKKKILNTNLKNDKFVEVINKYLIP
jgi:hypothetical protein